MNRAAGRLLLWAAGLSLARFLPAIELDPSFGQGGRVLAPINGNAPALRGMALQPDGKIVVCGDDGTHLVIARFTASGSLDPTFGAGGIVQGGIPSPFDLAGAVAVQPDGRIVIAGSAEISGATDFLVARYLPDGSLDGSFGAGGFVTTSFTPVNDGAEAISIMSDGRIVAAGFAGNGVATVMDYAVARYHPDGSPDTSFGIGGRATVDVGGPQDEGRGVVVRPDGRIVVGGLAIGPSGHNRFALAGLLADGQPDPGFGSSGLVFTTFPSDAGCFALALQADGKVIAAGSAGNPIAQFAVIRYRTDGSLDPAFGAGGIVLNSLSGTAEAFGTAVDDHGRVLAAGSSQLAGGPDFALARFLGNGSPDLTVGPGGWTNLGVGGDSLSFAGGNAVRIQPDGRILVAGVQILRVPNSVSSFAVVRLLDAAIPVPARSDIGSGVAIVLLALAGSIVAARLGGR